MIGFVPVGWTPPARLSSERAEGVSQAIAAHEAALMPAEPDDLRRVLSRLAMSCQMEDISAQVWSIRLSDFIEDVGHVPLDLVADACTQWRRTRKFWPVVADFLALIESELKARRRTMERLKVLERVAQEPAPDGIVNREWCDRMRGLGVQAGAGLRQLSGLVQGLEAVAGADR